jgi:hypothetical protein
MSWQIAFNTVGVVGCIAGIWSLYLVYRQTMLTQQQTDMMKEQAKQAKEREDEDSKWALRHEILASRLANIPPGMNISTPEMSGKYLCLYPAVFTEPGFRKKLETYIVEPNPSFTQFTPRRPIPHELRSPNLRATVARAEELIEKFKVENPKINLMYYMGAAKAV